MTAPLLDVQGLTIASARGSVVEDVTFAIEPGEVLGLVGESGSGKTVTCRSLIGLLPAGSLSVTAGSVRLEGRDIAGLDPLALGKVRGRQVGMIFQNPSSHLDPVMRIGDQIGLAVRHHLGLSRKEARARGIELLRQVGIPDPAARIDSYPHELSGGMRQRAMIATALACDPKLVIADEPTTALDVTVQAQILRLLLNLRDQRGVSILLVTHDLGVVAQTCDRIAVMYAGRIAEKGDKRQVLASPHHPYTRALIRCQPASGGGVGLLPSIPGQPPLAGAMPPGCRFHPRCERMHAVCRERQPALERQADGGEAACLFPVHAPVLEEVS
ncbi:ABC transporter ATP-binding protein [Geminicoccus roseus]|uniref:ABC transporter ATP-binding protein n=1 Tax=Geminicoccus roseus TaxID=404900 RepID=UPI000422D533|nr:ABC transporter ATP-binding protein [Geminicoccus roseus]